jgi:hypothetical protein
MDLVHNGCSLDLSVVGRRQMQSYLSHRIGGPDPEATSCAWDDVDDFAAQVDSVCCGYDGSDCPDNMPPRSCSLACAVAVHQFTTDCQSTLDIVLPAEDPMRTNLAQFESMCLDSAEGDDMLLQAIMDADCPESGEVNILQEHGAATVGWSNQEVTDVGSAGLVHGENSVCLAGRGE